MKKMCKRTVSGLLVVLMALSMVLTCPREMRIGKAAAEQLLSDADFTGDLWADGIWSLTPSTWDNTDFGYKSYSEDEWLHPTEECKTSGFKFWMQDAGSVTLLQNVSALKAGTYRVTTTYEGEKAAIQLTLGEKKSNSQVLQGYDQWSTQAATFKVEEDMENVSVGILISVEAGGYGWIDHVYLTPVAEGEEAEESEITPTPVDSSVTVAYNKDVKDDFMTGLDISSYISEKESGVKFYDFDGNELDDQGFFHFLKENGTNYIRIRVWNDPYDSEGHGYGGGNNDLAKAIQMGKWATNAGMKVLIDFHYSDFWADPAKQSAPKAWANMGIADKAKAVKAYTKESLEALLENGVDVGMVQVGNETTGGICGESNWDNMAKIFSAGSSAIREVSSENKKDILVAVHFTDPNKAGKYETFAKNLADRNVDYDVFASSYYPYWHGTIENLTSVLKQVATTYDKKVVVAETSWATSLMDADGHDNTVREGNNDSNLAYGISVQGQATEIAAVVKAVTDVGEAGIGFFYWEPAWLPVSNVYDSEGNVDAAKLAYNKNLWQTKGSGWATSYAGEFDAKDAGIWYGGSAVENQAIFDFDGHPLETARIFNLIRTGSIAPKAILTVMEAEVEARFGAADASLLPSKVTAKFNDGTTEAIDVVWDQKEVNAAIEKGVGVYAIAGTYIWNETTGKALCNFAIKPANLLVNGSFEDGEEGWTIEGFDLSQDDAFDGKKTLHYWSEKRRCNTATQKVTLAPGVYGVTATAQGGDAAEDDCYEVCATVGDKSYQASFVINGWKKWSTPEVRFTLTETTEVEITVKADAAAKAWGTVDDVVVYKVADVELSKDDKEEASDKDAIAKVEQAVEELTKNPEADKEVRVDYTENTVVSKELFETVKGKDVDVVFAMKDGDKSYTWTVNGKNIKDCKEIDLKVKFDANVVPTDVVNALAGDKETMQLHLEYDGAFGFDSVLTFEMPKKDAGQYANLYYFHDGKLEFMNAALIQEDGSVALAFNHASDYVIVVGENAAAQQENVQTQTETNQTTATPAIEKSPSTGDSAPIAALMVLLVLGGALLGFAVARRKAVK